MVASPYFVAMRVAALPNNTLHTAHCTLNTLPIHCTLTYSNCTLHIKHCPKTLRSALHTECTGHWTLHASQVSKPSVLNTALNCKEMVYVALYIAWLFSLSSILPTTSASYKVHHNNCKVLACTGPSILSATLLCWY